MNDDFVSKLKEQLKIAENLVSNIDESIRGEAFKYVLNRMQINNKITEEPEVIEKEATHPSRFYGELSKKVGIPANTLKLLVDYDEEKGRIVLNFTPNAKMAKEAQLAATVLYLSAKYAGLSDRTADSYELHDAMKHLAIRQLDHYAKYMGLQKKYLLIAGKRKKIYTLTQPGYELGISLLKDKANEVETV